MYSSYFVIKERDIVVKVVMRKKVPFIMLFFVCTSKLILHEILKEGEMLRYCCQVQKRV